LLGAVLHYALMHNAAALHKAKTAKNQG